MTYAITCFALCKSKPLCAQAFTSESGNIWIGCELEDGEFFFAPILNESGEDIEHLRNIIHESIDDMFGSYKEEQK